MLKMREESLNDDSDWNLSDSYGDDDKENQSSAATTTMVPMEKQKKSSSFSLKKLAAPLFIFGMIKHVAGDCESKSLLNKDWDDLKNTLCQLINTTGEEELFGNQTNSPFPLVFPGDNHTDENLTAFVNRFFTAASQVYGMVNYTDDYNLPCVNHSDNAYRSCKNITKYMIEPIEVHPEDNGVSFFIFFIIYALLLVFAICATFSLVKRLRSRYKSRNMIV